MKTISVLGLGYIGLPTALMLAKSGYKVNGFDTDKGKINLLKKGKLPFAENGLEKLYREAVKKGNFSPVENLNPADAFIIAVPTPQKEKGQADLKYVLSAINEIGKVLRDGNLVILESTVGPTDCERQIVPEIEKFKKSFYFAHCPEKAIPGNTLFEMVNNDRIVGGLKSEDADLAEKIYSKFVKGRIYKTTPKIAAASKVMENTYRDVNIALANEFSEIAEEMGFNVWEAIELANKHPRVAIHQPGPGVGGHCIPIDPYFLIGGASDALLIKQSRQINDSMPKVIASRVKKLIKNMDLINPTIGVLGYAYKKDVDDFRETPSETLIKILSKDFNILVSDPHVKSPPRNLVTDDELLKNSSVAILITDHEVYRDLEFQKYPNIKVVYDSRNILGAKNFKNSSAALYKLGVG